LATFFQQALLTATVTCIFLTQQIILAAALCLADIDTEIHNENLNYLDREALI
jgi:hypothetical protein